MFQGVNKVMRAYIYWDFMINSAWGLLGPVFAIFLLEKIAIGDVAHGARIVGFATFFYWFTKSILQLPIGYYLDKNHGEIDDFWFFVAGTLIVGVAPFGFLFSFLSWHIYILQIIYAIGMAMIVPSSYAIYVRHIDKGKEAYESGLDSALLGIGAGIAGAIGGIVVGFWGFQFIFIITGVFTFISVFFIYWMRFDLLPKTPQGIHQFLVDKDKS